MHCKVFIDCTQHFPCLSRSFMTVFSPVFPLSSDKPVCFLLFFIVLTTDYITAILLGCFSYAYSCFKCYLVLVLCFHLVCVEHFFLTPPSHSLLPYIQVLKKHLLLFRLPQPHSNIGFDMYDQLHPIRAKRLESIVGLQDSSDNKGD